MTPAHPMPIDRDAFDLRARLTLIALVEFAAGIPALLLFIASVVALALIPTGIGLALLLGLVPLLALWGATNRERLEPHVGHEIPGVPEPTPEGVIARFGVWVRDVVQWRNFAHAGFSGTGGFLMSGLIVTLAVGPAAHAVLAIVLSGPQALLSLVLIGPLAALWWILTPYLVYARLTADAAILGESRSVELERRVDEVTRSRSETIDHSAAELRRIERDLHDGAQARLVSLGLNLGLAQELLDRDPDAAAELLAEARASTTTALEELRSVVRQIHPPVLADRGLSGAVEALVLDLAVPVTLTLDLPGRLPEPVESAVYFAVSECLANIVKHADARRAWVVLRHDGTLLAATVGDDGRGGAAAREEGSGLAGVARRLAAFDGTMEVDSPVGGPTTIRMEVPCALSSPRTTPSSETD